MANKIELYREVLEFEPNSKVFFPLARQLAEQGQVDEAVALLTKGIGFHPDHLEAKFLLIDLLTRHGREGEAEAVFADVGALLARYPSVWLLWSRAAAARSRDPSLAMLFLGHYFQNDSLSWAEVMERGLRSLTEAAAAPRPAPAPVVPEPVVPRAVVAEPVAAPEPDRPRASAPESAIPQASVPEPAAGPAPDGVPPLRGAREVMELAELLEAPEAAGPVRPARSRETPVRTRTMAALLAEQGDRTGALEIYEELIAAAAPGAKREELKALAAALSPAPAPDASSASRPADPGATEPKVATTQPKGAAKLINMLEALAGRLEARSGV